MDLSAGLHRGAVVRMRDERWEVARALIHGETVVLEVSGCDRTNRHTRARFLLPIEPVEMLPASRTPKVVRPAVWRCAARRLLATALSANGALHAIASANVTLFPFQLEPAIALARGLGSRVLIADDVGLGKTVQAGLILAELMTREHGAHALIVSPAGLREQWRSELEMRFGIRAVPIDSAALARFGHGVSPGANPWRCSAVVITSIDYVKRPEVLRSLEGLLWDAVIFDEAHALSGTSDRSSAANALAARARLVVMLSATPHSGDEPAFLRLCSVGDLEPHFPLLVFRRTRRDVGIGGSRRNTWLRVRSSPEEIELQTSLMDYAREVWTRPEASSSGARLAMTVLVRRACSSAASLVRSLERRLALLEGESAANGSAALFQPLLPLWDTGADDEPFAPLMIAGLGNVEEERRRLLGILQLARAATHREAKLFALLRLLRRTTEPVIVFTEYRDTLSRIVEFISDFPRVALHGGLTSTERSECLQQFAKGDVRVLVATDAASEGLNLQQRCRLVVNLELPWSPLRLEQRVGRVDRMGQERRVHALHLIAGSTHEEHTVARLFARIARMHALTAELGPPALDEDDIAEAVIAGQDAHLAFNEPPPRSSHIVVPDLRAEAREEADRAATVRRLKPRTEGRVPLGRPILTRIGSRRSPSVYWLFRLAFGNQVGEHRFDLFLGLHQTTSRVEHNSKALRRALDRFLPESILRAMTEHASRCARTEERFRPLIELARTRELAVLQAVGESQARLSAHLLQPGLFDRRTDRAAAAQSALLHDVIAQGSARLEQLERNRSLETSSCDLLFGVFTN